MLTYLVLPTDIICYEEYHTAKERETNLQLFLSTADIRQILI
jgi:hypothetical protein